MKAKQLTTLKIIVHYTINCKVKLWIRKKCKYFVYYKRNSKSVLGEPQKKLFF